MHVALEASFPEGSIAPRRGDVSPFCQFTDFDRLDAPARALIAVDDAEISELRDYDVVSGHFSLPTLLGLTPAANIATVLREPRARLLSVYMFLRLTPIIDFWGPYGREVMVRAWRSLEACLSDPVVARTTDNQICRLLLHGDPRMPDGEFVAAADAEGLAEAALDRLDRLGFVGLLELDDIWSGLAAFFDTPLEARRTNVSGADEIPEGALPIPPFDVEIVLDLIEQRSVADRIVYDVLAQRRGGDPAKARRGADAAFAAELMRFGDMTGTSATRIEEFRNRQPETV